MIQLAAISLNDVSIDIPVYDVATSSIRKLILSSAVGGRFVQTGSTVMVNALKNIDLRVHDGDRIGLIGTNGAGKSTLLRVLSGVYPPTHGTVEVDGRVSPMFDVMLGMNPDATGLENIRLCGLFWGFTPRQIDERLQDIGDFTELGPFLTMPVRTYSNGMRLRLAFAVATAQEPEILLLDEVIGAGDAIFYKKALARMQDLVDRANILVVASHSDDMIRQLCNKAIWLDKGTLMEYGQVDCVLAAYAKMRETVPASPST